MEDMIKDLKDIRSWYETFLDFSIDNMMMSDREIAEYQELSNKFQKVIDHCIEMDYNYN